MRKMSFLIVVFLSCYSAFSQVIQSQRYEKIIKPSEDDYIIVPLKQDGLALVHGTDNYKTGKRSWELILLDTTLQELWMVEFEVNNHSNLIGLEHSPGFAHVLFIKNRVSCEMELISVDLEAKKVTQHEIKPELNYQLTHFNKVGENFIFGGFVNLDPCVLLFNPSNENLKIVPGFFQKNTELIDIRVNQNKTFNTIILDRSLNEDRKVIFTTFDSFGEQLLENTTVVEKDIFIQTGMSSVLEREDLLVFGTWGKKNSKQASGFYAFPISPFNENKIKPIYFGQLEHYLDYLKPKRAKVIKERTQKSLDRNETPNFTNYVVAHQMLEHERGFLVLAESFTSSSKNNQSSYGYNSYGYPYYTPYNYPYGTYNSSRRYPQSQAPNTPYGDNVINPEELKKIESILINVDESGKVLWDFSMKFDDVHVESSRQVSTLFLEPDTLHIMYKGESELKIKTVALVTEESFESTQKIKLSDSHSEIRDEEKQIGTVERWFENCFYVWGYQTIRDTMKRSGKNRDVFYINKISIR